MNASLSQCPIFTAYLKRTIARSALPNQEATLRSVIRCLNEALAYQTSLTCHSTFN